MNCCGPQLGMFDNWCFLIGGVVLALLAWLAYLALTARKCGVECLVNYVCAKCGAKTLPGWKFCPVCGNGIDSSGQEDA